MTTGNDINNICNKDKNMLLILLYLPSLLIFKIFDNDIWFLLNSGRYIMNYGIPNIEPFTIHNNLEFVMQQWLSSVIYWLAYNNCGEVGIYLVMISTFILIVFVMYKITSLISNGKFLISYTITMYFSIMLSLTIRSRPMIFTLLLLTFELYSLEKYIASNNRIYLLILPILSFLSINLHAAMWPILFIILIPYIIDSFGFKYKSFCCQHYEKKFLIFIVVIMVLIAIFNPYGTKSMTYLFRSYGYPEISNYVNEMKPPNINHGYGVFVFSLFFVIIITYIFFRGGKTKIRYILLTFGTGLLALSSNRSFPFFMICSIFPLAYYLKDVNIKLPLKHLPNNDTKLRKTLILAVIILLVCNVFIGNDRIVDNEFNDLEEIIEYIIKNYDLSHIILYTAYKEGSYTQFMGLKSYIDPRAEVFVKKNNKKDDIMKEYTNLQDGKIYYKNVLDKYKFTHLIVSESDILFTYLPYDEDYEIVKSNKSYILFKKIK